MLTAALLALCTLADGDRMLAIQKIAAGIGGEVGVSAVNLESGCRMSFNGGEHFPMQSVYKVPIAIHVLRLADQGRLDLASKVTMTADDIRPGVSPISDELAKHPVTIETRDLVRRMVQISDNAASDRVLTLGGGPDAVMTTLHELHIDGINVTRSEKEMAIAFYGLDPNVPMTGFGDAVEHTPLGRREMALRRYLLDANNSATPDAMTALLVALQSGHAASPDSTRLLLKWMTDTDTGPDRLRGLLPAGAVVAHKTGTSGDTNGLNGCTNDVGIITLPDGRGHLVVSVFTKGSARPLKERERAIAEIARLLCVASDPVRDQRH